MCLSKNTLKYCIDKYPFSEEDKLFVIDAYKIIWDNLDHSRTYCLNPSSMCAEILRRSGRTSYNVWMPKNEYKIDAYEEVIMLMMNVLNKENDISFHEIK